MSLFHVNYIEKGIGMHAAIAAAGRMLWQQDGIWVADSPDVQQIIDNYPAALIAQDLVVKIKALAGEKISARYPSWKQLNMLARHAEITVARERTSDDLAELALLEHAWVWIKSIRLASDIHEAVLLAHAQRNDFAALLGYDINAGWPDL